MLKPVAAMTDHEMLVELMYEKRRNDRARNIKYMIAGAVLVLIIILSIKYVPPVVRYFQRLRFTLFTQSCCYYSFYCCIRIFAKYRNEFINKTRFETMQNSVAAIQGVADSINETITNLWDKLGGLFR